MDKRRLNIENTEEPRSRKGINKLYVFLVLGMLIVIGYPIMRISYLNNKVLSSSAMVDSNINFGLPSDITDTAFKSNIMRYYKTKYGVSLYVSDIEREGDSIKALIKDSEDNSEYHLIYSYDISSKRASISEDYGKVQTSKIMNKYIDTIIGSGLPKNATINVLVRDIKDIDSNISYSGFEKMVSEWDVGDLVSYNKANRLIEEINIDIISGSSSTMRKYSKQLLTIVTTLDSGMSDSPKLNVVFFKGKNSRGYVYESIESKYGKDRESIYTGLNWYEEIKEIKGASNYMYGAIHIDSNASTVLNEYIEEDKEAYTIEGVGDIPVYQTVSEILKGDKDKKEIKE